MEVDTLDYFYWIFWWVFLWDVSFELALSELDLQILALLRNYWWTFYWIIFHLVSSLCELDLHIPVRLRDKVGNNTKWWPLLLHLEPVQIFQNCFFISIFIILSSLPLHPLKIILINDLLTIFLNLCTILIIIM